MRTIKIKGHKLESADVTHVSLVDRGANRIPFRITKADITTETPMKLALKNLLSGKGGEATKDVSISAFVLQKGEHFEVAKKALADIGVKVDDSEEQDGCVVFKQDGDVDYDNDVGLEGRAVAVLVKAFNPYDMRAASYTDILKTQGFLPSLQTANEALFQSVINSISKADITPDTLVSEVESSLTEFSSYVVGLCKGIPSTAFKADMAVTAAIEKAKKAEPPKKKEEKPAVKKDEKPVKKEEGFDAKALKEAVTASITAALAPVTKSVTDLSKKVDGVVESMDEIKETAEEARDTAKKAEQRVRGTTVTDPDDDPDDTDSRRKEEDDGDMGGTIDTAMMPHIRRKRAGYEDRRRAAEEHGR